MNLNNNSEYYSETFEDVDFSHADLNSIEFEGCTFRHCNFSESTFDRCNFVDCEFNGCNLTLANVQYSRFSDVVFHESKLVGVDWTKAAWPRLVFTSPIKFYKSIINDSSFYGLSLSDLAIEECKAHNVDFREGDFSNGNFTYSDLTGSLFSKTKLVRADFSEAVNYDIDIFNNLLKHAKFTRFEAVNLLSALEIELVD